MNKYLIVGLALAVLPFGVSADEGCPEGQVMQSVMTDPGSPEVPAVTHIVHHDEVAHWVWVYRNHQWRHDKIVDVPAYDEVVVDVPAIPAVPATYENQCVVDEDYVPPAEEPETPPTPPVEVPVVSKKKGESSAPMGGHRRCYPDFVLNDVICPVGGLTWEMVLKYVLK